MSGKLTVAETIRQKLQARFDPKELEVVDDSESHRGHAGWRDGGQTHFNVRMVAASLNGKSRVAAQRAVYAALREEMKDQIHALALDVRGEA